MAKYPKFSYRGMPTFGCLPVLIMLILLATCPVLAVVFLAICCVCDDNNQVIPSISNSTLLAFSLLFLVVTAPNITFLIVVSLCTVLFILVVRTAMKIYNKIKESNKIIDNKLKSLNSAATQNVDKHLH